MYDVVTREQLLRLLRAEAEMSRQTATLAARSHPENLRVEHVADLLKAINGKSRVLVDLLTWAAEFVEQGDVEHIDIDTADCCSPPLPIG